MPHYNVTIFNGGQISWVHDEALTFLEELGQVSYVRASQVEFDDVMAGWVADMSPVGGPAQGPFARRSEALAWEKMYLEDRMFKNL